MCSLSFFTSSASSAAVMGGNLRARPPDLEVFRHPALDLFPGPSAIDGLVEVIARLAVDIGPAPPVEPVGLGDAAVKIARVGDEVADAPVVEGPEPLPGLAAVDRLIEAALAVRLVVVELAFGRDVDDVRVLGIDLRAGVLGLPDAAAGGEDVVGRGLTRGHGELRDPAREIDRADPAPAE